MYFYDYNLIQKLVKYQDLNLYELQVDIQAFLSCIKVQIFKEKSIVDVT